MIFHKVNVFHDCTGSGELNNCSIFLLKMKVGCNSFACVRAKSTVGSFQWLTIHIYKIFRLKSKRH